MMKILHVKLNGIVNDENKLKEKLKNNLSEGILITDDSMSVEVLEFDDVKITSTSYFSNEERIEMTYDEMVDNYKKKQGAF